jgi:hypothetical protein
MTTASARAADAERRPPLSLEAAERHVARLASLAASVPNWLPVDNGARANLRAASRGRGYGPQTVAPRDMDAFCRFVVVLYAAPFCHRPGVSENLAEYVSEWGPSRVPEYGDLRRSLQTAGDPETTQLATAIVGPCSYYRGWHAVVTALNVAAHARLDSLEPTPGHLMRLFSLFRQPPAPMRRRLGENARALARAFYEDAAPVLPVLADALEEDGFRSTWRHVRFFRECSALGFPGMWPLAPHWYEADAPRPPR